MIYISMSQLVCRENFCSDTRLILATAEVIERCFLV